MVPVYVASQCEGVFGFNVSLLTDLDKKKKQNKNHRILTVRGVKRGRKIQKLQLMEVFTTAITHSHEATFSCHLSMQRLVFA